MGNLSDDIVKYKKGALSPQEMHALEKKALVDPFLAEALEGVEDMSSHDLTTDVSSLNKRITDRKKKNVFTPLRIAAGIGVILGSAFVIYQLVPKTKTIALKMEKSKGENKEPEGAKAGAGNQPKESAEQMAVDQRGKSKVENQKLSAESAAQKSDKSQKPVKIEEPPSAKIQAAEPQKENPEAESAAPLTQTVAQGLAAQQQQEIVKKDEDQAAKEIAGPGQVGGTKSVPLEGKKNALAGEAQRSAVSNAKINRVKSISGRVVSVEDGSPLPGVTVVLKGTTIGTVTDSNGDFKIPTDSDNKNLVFSFIGLQSQEIDASNKDKVDVQMKGDDAQLSEVVVTAMGVSRDDQVQPVIKWAEPEGGRKAYDRYLESNAVYPEEARKNKIKGKAGIEFTVGTDGSLSDFRTFKKLGYGCEDEIIRLVKGGPKWNPTTEDNKPVESTVRVRLRFDPAKMAR